MLDYKKYFEKGIPFDTYQLNMEEEIKLGIINDHSQYIPQNMQRMKRIGKTIKLIPEINEALTNLKHNYNWLIISEHWCGDASQIVPIMNAIAKQSDGKINLKLIYRDENLELMNAHLTNGTQSIPILLQLDENFHLNKVWGPRPQPCIDFVQELKKSPNFQEEFKEKLHKWYADDKGMSTQIELLSLLK